MCNFLKKHGGDTKFVFTRAASDIVLFWTLETHLKGQGIAAVTEMAKTIEKDTLKLTQELQTINDEIKRL